MSALQYRPWNRYALILLALAAVLLLAGASPLAWLHGLLDPFAPDGRMDGLAHPLVAAARHGLAALGALFGTAGAGLLALPTPTRQALNRLHAGLLHLQSDARSFARSLALARLGRWEALALLGVTACGALIRFGYLWGPMQYDESYTYIAFASQPLLTVLSDYHLPNNHIFHTMLVHLSCSLFGMQPWAVRLPAYLAGLLMIPAAYLLARQQYSRSTAFLSSALVASFPLWIQLSANARGYTLLAVITLLTFALGGYLLKHANLAGWAVLAILAALGFYTVPVMLYPFSTLLVWMLVSFLLHPADTPYQVRSFFLHLLGTGLTTGLLTALLYLPVLVVSGPQALFANPFVQPVETGLFFSTFGQRLLEDLLSWFDKVPPLVSLLLAAGFVASLLFHRRISRLRISIPLVTLAWLGLLLSIQRPDLQSKVWWYLVPLFLIWSAAGWVEIWRVMVKKPAASSISACVAGFLLISALIWAARVNATANEYRLGLKHDIESAIEFISQQIGPDDVLVADFPTDAPAWYYARLYGIHDRQVRKFEQRSDYHLVYVLVASGQDQSLKSVLSKRGPQTLPPDLASARQIKQFGAIDLYTCAP